MREYGPNFAGELASEILINGARYAKGAHGTGQGPIQICAGRIRRIGGGTHEVPWDEINGLEIDLSGFFIMPGLINAHDHLEFSLFPRLGNPPYRNYVEWGEDIHQKFPDIIAKHRAVRKELRLWWGGIRNLLCGSTTVSHHNPLWPELRRSDFPVRVIQRYGWAHSPALGGDLRAARAATAKGGPFILHACEGVDEVARAELWDLDNSGILDNHAVLVHGLAIDAKGFELLQERGTALIVCPSSNNFLFGELPDMDMLGGLTNIALGNDSPLTAEGDLLDEVRFAIRSAGIAPCAAYRMVTTAPAAIFRLRDGEGAIRVSGVGDLIAVRDTSQDAADRLRGLSMEDIELVMVNGVVQLASESVVERLPSPVRQGLEALWIDGITRWVRAPVERLCREAEETLGRDEIRLGTRRVRVPDTKPPAQV